MNFRTTILAGLYFALSSCAQPDSGQQPTLSNFADGHFQVYIETSAGEHFEQFYNDSTATLDTLQLGFSKPLPFLPFPVNSGFLANYATPDSTLEKVEAWVFGLRQPAGQLQAAQPLARLHFIESGEQKSAYVMVPADQKMRFFDAVTFEDFTIRYDHIKYAFEYWLRHKNGIGKISRLKWDDESVATRELRRQLNFSDK